MRIAAGGDGRKCRRWFFVRVGRYRPLLRSRSISLRRSPHEPASLAATSHLDDARSFVLLSTKCSTAVSSSPAFGANLNVYDGAFAIRGPIFATMEANASSGGISSSRGRPRCAAGECGQHIARTVRLCRRFISAARWPRLAGRVALGYVFGVSLAIATPHRVRGQGVAPLLRPFHCQACRDTSLLSPPSTAPARARPQCERGLDFALILWRS